MRTLALIFFALIVSSCATPKANLEGNNDANIWLENIEGEKALKWVNQQNKKALDEMTGSKRFKRLETEALEILQAKDKIPHVSMRGQYLYNFWQDKKHVRGLLRRTTVNSYKKKNPKWETVLDLDKLSKTEKENWVYKGLNCLAPAHELCLLNLSRGGKDAGVVREFNSRQKTFVKNGFHLKEAKSWVDWIDDNNIFVATDFGTDSLTDSGYARFVKVWTRGTELSKAKRVRTAAKEDMAAYGATFSSPDGPLSIVATMETFYTSTAALYENGKSWEIPKQKSAKLVGVYKNHFLLELRKLWELDGQSYSAGSVVAFPVASAKAGVVKASEILKVYTPAATASVLQVAVTKNEILISVLENVTGKIYSIKMGDEGLGKPELIPYMDNVHLALDSSSPYSDLFFATSNGFLNPDSLVVFESKTKKFSKIKSLSSKFSSKGMEVQQKWAISKDGTKIPYFLVGKSEVIKKKNAPTLLYGYGGFEVSLTPSYKPLVGKLWLENGGLYAMANIRGGGEFGPKWHQAALKKNRQKAYDDFIAVGEDLVSSGVSSKEKLAIQGGSNGGLLVGAVMTQRPELFKAVLCHVPLLDMVRYSQLLAGASWMGEYGDPKEDSMRKYLLGYSPYHNVSADKKYPELFLMTSTKDDRVHPGHARKMAAKMTSLGHKNIRYYENTEGGHAASANLKQKARMRALSYEFLYKTIYQ